MKLLVTLVLASALVLKTAEGAAGDVDDVCNNDACTDTNAECKDESSTKNCRCKATYENKDGTCKLSNGQTCTDDDGCASGFCKGDTGKTCAATKDLNAACTDADRCTDDNAVCKDGACKLSNGQTCTGDDGCASGFCKDDNGKTCAATIALEATCTDADRCTADNSECTGDPKKCACKANYEKTGDACKLENGQPCTADGDCAKGTCPTAIKKCGKANDETCTENVDCASGNCKTMETDSGGTEKKCADGASAIVASVLLMVSALLTSRFL